MKLIDKLAWINIVDGRLLVARSHGQRAFYVPGGKREQGEGDADALAREVREELAVRIVKNGIRHVLTHEAEAHGKSGTTVRLTCYGAEHEGNIVPSSEIEEITWVTAEDDGLLSEGARGVVEDLAAQGLVRRESPEPRAILFDLDDTLVQTRVVKWKHHQEVARRFYGIDLTEDALSEAWGMPFDAMIARLYQDSAPRRPNARGQSVHCRGLSQNRDWRCRSYGHDSAGPRRGSRRSDFHEHRVRGR